MDLAKELKNAASKLKAPDEIEEFLLDVIPRADAEIKRLTTEVEKLKEEKARQAKNLDGEIKRLQGGVDKAEGKFVDIISHQQDQIAALTTEIEIGKSAQALLACQLVELQRVCIEYKKQHAADISQMMQVDSDNISYESDIADLKAENRDLKVLLAQAECPHCPGNGVIITGHCVGHLTDGLKSKPCGFCKQRKELLK